MLGDRCSQGKKLWLQELWVLSGDDDKWSQNHVMTCEKDLYKTQNPCIRNTKTELSHMGTELGLGWLAQLGLGKPTRVRCRPGAGAPLLLTRCARAPGRFKKKELSHTEWVLSLRLKLSLHEETASECSETRSMYIHFHRYVHYRSLSVTPVWLIASNYMDLTCCHWNDKRNLQLHRPLCPCEWHLVMRMIAQRKTQCLRPFPRWGNILSQAF